MSLKRRRRQPWIFPEFVPENTYGTVHVGFVGPGGSGGSGIAEYSLRVCVPGGPSDTAGGRVEACPALFALLTEAWGGRRAVEERLRLAPDLDGFLVDLDDTLQRWAGKRHTDQPALPPARFYDHLLAEVAAVGWERVVRVSPSLLSFDIRVADAGGRPHDAHVDLPPDFPGSPARVSVALPGYGGGREGMETGAATTDVSSSGKASFTGGSVVKALARATCAMDRFCGAWDVICDFDAHCRILEPSPPSLAVLSRRIAIGKHCSLSVDINARSPRAPPDVRFFGPEALVGPLKKRLHKHNANGAWDERAMPRINLEAALGQAFPQPGRSDGKSRGDGTERAGDVQEDDYAHDNEDDDDDLAVDCGICYAYRNDGNLPDCCCENACCGRAFHKDCLAEWLSALTTTHQSFNSLFGECPYCSDPISVRM